ncbi:hypothetical protein [Flammeovirga sp. SJP92]|uniref:hypothetical protein n=1 Tax=Flammeovirga sp. SJP92 TaxID=1775430 RepID=UPI000787B188|nr:hypothetical protein [Flammeovirga sp. SJP92]KXX68959.1 hypothetical protein AVL50_17515 [Flammeovirga sp. SJP92]
MSVKIKELNIKIEIKKDFLTQEQLMDQFIQKLSIDKLPVEFIESLAEKCKEEIDNDQRILGTKFGRF